MHKSFLSLMLMALAAVGTAGCAEIVNTHGHVIKDSQLDRIKIGLTEKDEVARILGTPSTTATFETDRWYYITSTTKDKPLNPNILTDRQVVIVDFDRDGVVSSLSFRDEEDGRQLDPTDRTTPTQGQSLGLMEQLLGNLGFGL